MRLMHAYHLADCVWPVCAQVRGVLNDEEVQMAVADSRYLRGVHALVATPDMALALHSLPNSPLSFQVWCRGLWPCICVLRAHSEQGCHLCCLTYQRALSAVCRGMLDARLRKHLAVYL